MKPRVSVLVFTQDHARWISACLEGILAQEVHVPVEVLVGDAGSTDGTRDICLAYAEAHPHQIRVRLQGPEDTILVGGRPTDRFTLMTNLQRANGDYIALCPGNACWTDPHKLQRQVDALEGDSTLAMSFHRVERRGPEGRFGGTFPRSLPRRIPVERLLASSNFIPGCSVMYRRSMLPDPFPAWLWREAPVPDLPIHVLAGLSGDFHFHPTVMASVPAQGPWTALSPSSRAHAMVRIRELLLQELAGEREAILRRTLARKRLELAVTCAIAGDPMGARAAANQVDLRALPQTVATQLLRLKAQLGLTWPTAARWIDRVQTLAETRASRVRALLTQPREASV